MENEEKEQLVKDCIKQIKKDLANFDTTAITELLLSTPTENLKSYLPE